MLARLRRRSRRQHMETTTHTITHIVSTPNVCGGRPRIDGTRIRVIDIVDAYEDPDPNNRWDIDRIVEEFEVTPAQIHAALAYYHDHRDEIDQAMKDDEAFAEAFRLENDVTVLSDCGEG